MNEEIYLTVREASFSLKVHPLSIRRYISQGKLKATKIGGNVRIHKSSIDLFGKEMQPSAYSSPIRPKIERINVFTLDDPFFRLRGRGLSILV